MENHLAQKIKQIRNKNNLSQTRFGNKIEVSGKTISAYETGKITPSYKVLERISNTYQIPLSEFNQKESNKLRNKINKLQSIIGEIESIIS